MYFTRKGQNGANESLTSLAESSFVRFLIPVPGSLEVRSNLKIYDFDIPKVKMGIKVYIYFSLGIKY